MAAAGLAWPCHAVPRRPCFNEGRQMAAAGRCRRGAGLCGSQRFNEGRQMAAAGRVTRDADTQRQIRFNEGRQMAAAGPRPGRSRLAGEKALQ